MWSSERSVRAALACVLAALLAACSFHLRGQAQLPFETLYIPGANPLVVELKRNVAAGRVSEYQLRYRVGFRVTDAKGAQVYLPTSEVLLTRDMAYSDAQVLAKEAEEALLYRDMQRDMVQQIMRRLVAAKPASAPIE
jgi:LPS-assembly lipoprotein